MREVSVGTRTISTRSPNLDLGTRVVIPFQEHPSLSPCDQPGQQLRHGSDVHVVRELSVYGLTSLLGLFF